MVVGSVPPVDWMGGGFLTEQKINSSKRGEGKIIGNTAFCQSLVSALLSLWLYQDNLRL